MRTSVHAVIIRFKQIDELADACVREGSPFAHPANARFSLDHLITLWGKRVIGVLGGSGRSGQLIPALVDLFSQGRFPFDRLVKFYDMDQIVLDR